VCDEEEKKGAGYERGLEVDFDYNSNTYKSELRTEGEIATTIDS